MANWLGEEVQSLLLVWIFYHTFYGCLGQKLSSAMRTRVTLLLVRNLETIRSIVGLDDSGTFFWVGGTYMKSRRATGSGSGSTEVPEISQSGRLKRYRQPDNGRDEDSLQIQFSENAQKSCNTFRFVCSKKMCPAPKSVSANYMSTGTEKFCSDFPLLLVLLPSGVILIIIGVLCRK